MTSPLIWYSASQLSTFDRCALKWWWEKVGGFKPPPSASQEVGTAIHLTLENWVHTGAEPVDPRAKEALRHFRERGVERGETLLSERQFNHPLHIPNRVMTGKVDITILDDKKPRVWDFKSTSDIRKYGKTDYQLEADIQLNIYAHDTFTTMAPKAQTLEAAHLYIQTRGAIRSELVPVTLERHDVAKRWAGYLKVVDTIEEVRLETDPSKVPYNEMACNDYGGCPHRTRCNALIFESPTNLPEKIPGTNAIDDSFWASFDDGTKRDEEEETEMLNPPDTTRRADGAPPATPNTVAFDDLPEVLQKERKKHTVQNASTTQNAPIKEKSMDLSKIAALGAGKPATIESKPLGQAASMAAKLETPAEPSTRKILDAQPLTTLTTPTRGRPPGSKNKKDPTADALAAADAVISHSTEIFKREHLDYDKVLAAEEQENRPSLKEINEVTVEKTTPPKAVPVGDLLFLLVDCVPVTGFPQGAITLGAWLAPILEAIKKDTGAPWDFHEFRKGPAILNRYAQQAQLPQALVMNSRSPEAGILTEYLVSKAKCILTGTR